MVKMAEIYVKQYYEGDGGFLLPSEYTITFDSAKESDLSGLFGKYRALYVDAGNGTVDVKVPEDPSLIHVVVNEISEMLQWAKSIDSKYIKIIKEPSSDEAHAKAPVVDESSSHTENIDNFSSACETEEAYSEAEKSFDDFILIDDSEIVYPEDDEQEQVIGDDFKTPDVSEKDAYYEEDLLLLKDYDEFADELSSAEADLSEIPVSEPLSDEIGDEFFAEDESKAGDEYGASADVSDSSEQVFDEAFADEVLSSQEPEFPDLSELDSSVSDELNPFDEEPDDFFVSAEADLSEISVSEPLSDEIGDEFFAEDESKAGDEYGASADVSDSSEQVFDEAFADEVLSSQEPEFPDLSVPDSSVSDELNLFDEEPDDFFISTEAEMDLLSDDEADSDLSSAGIDTGDFAFAQSGADEDLSLSLPETSEPQESESVLLAGADELFLSGKPKEALLAYEKVLEINPENKDALIRRADIFYDEGRYSEALLEYNAAGGAANLSSKSLEKYAEAQRASGLIKEALQSYDRILSISFDNAEILLKKFSILKSAQRDNEARFVLDRLIEINPSECGLWYEKALLDEKSGNLEEALCDYDAIIKLNDDFTEVWVRKALLLIKLKRHSEALVCYERLIEKKPDYSGIWYSTGLVQRVVGKYEEALHSFDVALALSPGDMDAMHERGRVLESLERYDEALLQYLSILENGPENYIIYCEAGAIQQKKGLFDEAIFNFSRAVEKNPADLRALLGRAECEKNSGMLKEAVLDYSKVTQNDPENESAWLSLGELLEKDKNYEEALSAYEKTLLINSASDDALRGKLRSLIHTKRYEESLPLYDQLIVKTPGDAGLIAGKASLLEKTGHYDEAALLYRTAVRLDTKNTANILSLITLLSDMNLNQETIPYYDMLISILPDETDILMSKGIAHYTIGQYEMAAMAFKRVSEMRPDDPEPLLKAGLSLIMLGKPREALNYYLKTIDIDPHYGNVWLKSGIDATFFMEKKPHANAGASSAEPVQRPAPVRLTKEREMKEKEEHSLEMPSESSIKSFSKEDLKPAKRVPVRREASKKPTKEQLSDPDYLYSKGISLTKLRYYDAAAKCFERAFLLDSENAAYIFSLGIVYGKTGTYDKALECFEKALEIEPGHEGAAKGKLMALKSIRN